MKRSPEKHLQYFALLDALDFDTCPCCRYVTVARGKFWQALLYENTNDRGFRREFSEGHGFCSRHAYELVRLKDGLTTAILYSGILNSANKRFDTTKPKWYSPGTGCPVCHREVVWEKRFLGILYAFIEDDQVRQRISEGHVLCMPHLRTIQAIFSRLPSWFLADHHERYSHCEHQLSRYIDSCNYSIRDRPVLGDDEQRVWGRTIGLLYGYEGCTGR